MTVLQVWPKYHEEFIVSDTINVSLHLNGSLLGTLAMPAGSASSAEAIESFVMASSLYKVVCCVFNMSLLH